MTILVTGSDGQLGQCIKKVCTFEEELKRIIPSDDFELRYYFTNRENFDIAGDDVKNKLSELSPDIVINCAAYVATDAAESNVKTAFLANTYGPMNLAEACEELGIKLIHISTDYVFDGKNNVPYKETDKCNPINVYGMTKMFGEEFVMMKSPTSVIIRTSWLYSEFGNNFVMKTLSNIAENKPKGYVYDEIASPTYAMNLARFILTMCVEYYQYVGNSRLCPIHGIYHFTDSGVASRYDFATEIEAIVKGVRGESMIYPVLSSSFNTAAKRPMYSVLNTKKATDEIPTYKPVSWRSALYECLMNIEALSTQ